MYRKSSKGWLKHFDFILIDLISLHLAFVLSYVCRHGIGNPYKNLLYRNMAFMLTFIDFFVVFLFETLKGVLRRGYYQELAATVKHVILVMLLAVLYLFTIQEGTSFSRSVLYFTAMFYIIFAYVTRILWKKHLQKRIENGGDRSLLIITSSDIAAEVVRSMQEHNYQRFNLVGIVLVDKDMKGQKIEGIPVLANEEDAANYVCREWIDEVFLVISEKIPLSTEAGRSAVRNRCNGAFKSGKAGRCDRKEAVGREAGRLYSIDNQHKLCNCEAGSYEEKSGYYRWIGRMYFNRNNFHICGTCNLYSVARSDFLLTGSSGKERQEV